MGHSLLGIVYHLLQSGGEYSDLGGDYFERVEPERLKRSFVKRLEQLGYAVNLERRELDEPSEDGPGMA